MIDHRGGQGLDGHSGALQEFDTVNCGHCQALVAVLSRPTEKVYLDGVDVARAAGVAPHLGHEYKGKRPCRRCRKPLCRACAAAGGCDPFVEQLERLESARARGRAG